MLMYFDFDFDFDVYFDSLLFVVFSKLTLFLFFADEIATAELIVNNM